MITVIDYGVGNLGSIHNMLQRLGHESIVSSNQDVIARADALILPGVGAFDNAMRKLVDSGIVDCLNELVLKERKPILGICLGMQLMTEGSEEGNQSGLGWIEAQTQKFQGNVNGLSLRIPHMGWNHVKVIQNGAIMDGFDNDSRFYFVHSYHVNCNHHQDVMSTTFYGIEFHSAFHKGNIYGTQFHPEKSHKFGMKLLNNFASLYCKTNR